MGVAKTKGGNEDMLFCVLLFLFLYPLSYKSKYGLKCMPVSFNYCFIVLYYFQLIYRTSKHPQFCLVHYLASGVPGLEQPVILCDQNISKTENDFHLQLSDDSMEVSASESHEENQIIQDCQTDACGKFLKQESKNKICPTRKGKIGRVRSRGLIMEDNCQNKIFIAEDGQKDGRKQEYTDGMF